ncbi:hypothetical protein BG910_01810 [Neisseria chenwenguii]|uniref:ABM domain-containing protein n=1 Tax=Neisseria chenwenguii TaxID=1853278 RepID=A0A220RZL5_9NEIS|nr:antibiotic biosynthesis monooxygenase [Neisseria chenwenguii]ASK26644.1 hypothetical protein BG910_01810 [Neisseria chenwenguii]
MKKLSVLMMAMLLNACATLPEPPQSLMVRLFELQTPTQQIQRFSDTVHQTMLFSHAHEPDTLAMYSLRKTDDATFNYVFEIYQDGDAYQVHTQSDAFKHYRAIAPEMVNGRKVIETAPQFLYEREAVNISGSLKKPFVRLAQMQVKPEYHDDFKQELLGLLRHAVDNQSGILALYAVTAKDSPNDWYLFEIYDNAGVHQAVQALPEFSRYRAKVSPMLANAHSQALDGVVLTSKGRLK